MVKKSCGYCNWVPRLLLVLGIFVLFVFILVDVNMLSRWLVSFKRHDDGKEYFAEARSKLPYVNMTAALPVAQEELVRKVNATKDAVQCQDSCSYDDKCQAFVFDTVKTDCKLLYEIHGYNSNSEALFTKSSGLKQRDYIAEGGASPTRKFLRLEAHELPPSGAGKLATHQFIPDVHECKNKCLAHNDPAGKCMAFEYDFNTKACTLSSSVNGKPAERSEKDTYVIIN